VCRPASSCFVQRRIFARSKQSLSLSGLSSHWSSTYSQITVDSMMTRLSCNKGWTHRAWVQRKIIRFPRVAPAQIEVDAIPIEPLFGQCGPNLCRAHRHVTMIKRQRVDNAPWSNLPCKLQRYPFMEDYAGRLPAGDDLVRLRSRRQCPFGH
jgi:hypothetical protein